MVFEIPQLSSDQYLALCLVLATILLYRVVSSFSNDAKNDLRDKTLLILLLLHTLYMLHALLVSPPKNIFKSLGLPANIPPEYLRAKLLEVYGGEQNVPAALVSLSKRLGLMDLRALYIRFGHEVVAGCSYCQSTDDYALSAFPTPLLEYILEIAFVGILTLPRASTSYMRPLGLGALLASMLAEIYWTLTVHVIIPPFGNDTPITMWHDSFVQLRHTLFLLLPLLITTFPSLGLHRIPILGTLIPIPSQSSLVSTRPKHLGQELPIPPNVTLSQMSTMMLQTLNHLLPTLHLLKYTHGAVMRSQGDGVPASSPSPTSEDGHTEAASSNPTPTPSSEPSFHALSTQWWAEEAREGRIVRTDRNVRRELKLNGLVSEEEGELSELPDGQLLLGAKMAIKMLKERGVRPSDHWSYTTTPSAEESKL